MSSDPRAERTRRQLRDAVVALAERSDGTLTVSAVTRQAGVNRSSFYAHYDSLEQVAVEMLDESLATIAELGWQARAENRGAGSQDLLALVEHVAAQRRVYSAVLSSADAAAAEVHVARLLGTRFAEAFARYGADGVVDAARVQAAAIAVGAGMAALLAAWLRGDLTSTHDQLADHLAAVLPPWTHQLHHPDIHHLDKGETS